ncbi:ATP-dependent Clp protease adaptor ClpS [Moraxella haemolytica]|uniref:ATP-dependent Clp protease adaptor ClpS n=1 Tax=Moraxella haemolytica TaxID=2904119 RepID=UPI002542A790|nr:ATP-dependent Clp protease adaptor ClpS [Moraxella sp. ZY171148]WII95910.1 ATP-dependent Clp protease adaptor ClpS [Moraxella sp. ZY171148]
MSIFSHQNHQMKPSGMTFDMDSDVALDEITDVATERLEPLLYSVVLHNDDYTTMDFVVHVLVDVFGHTLDKAVELMYCVHEKGRAVVAVLPYDIAEMRVAQVTELAEALEYPLLATLEKN